MKQYCSTCGMEMTYYHQNQSWYCHSCQKYAEPVQFQAQSQQVMHPQQQQAYQPHTPLVDEKLAKSKIYGGMRMRDSTDKIISTRWAFGILAFQLIVPILTVALLYLYFVGTNFNLSNIAQIAVIIVIFLAAIVMVIFQSALVYKLVGRRDEHFRRDAMMKQGMMEYLDAVSVKEMKDINVERWTMNTIFYSNPEASRGPSLWALLVGLVAIIPVIGIFAMLYCLYFLTRDVHDHDLRQRDFNYQFQLALYKMGKVNSISYDWIPMPKRDPAAYVLVSVLTIGFFLPYWWYVNIVDMNSHMKNQWHFEGQLIKMIDEQENPKPNKEVQRPDEIPTKP